MSARKVVARWVVGRAMNSVVEIATGIVRARAESAGVMATMGRVVAMVLEG